MKKAEALKALLGARKDGDCAPRKIDMPFVEYSALIKDVLANGCTNSEKTKQLLEEETH